MAENGGAKNGGGRPESGCSPAMRKRLIILGVIMCAVLAPVLIGSIFNVQFLAKHNGKSFAELALDNQLQEYRIAAERGSIVDTNGKVLAQNATAWTVAVYPAQIRTAANNRSEAEGAAAVEKLRVTIAQNLSAILGMDYDKVYEMTGRSAEYVAVKRRVEKATADLVSAFMLDNKITRSVALNAESKRYYPYGGFAATVLGFTGTDNQGLSGLEYYYETMLKGISGKVVTLKDGVNADMPSEYESTVDAVDGYTLELTVDEVVQMYLEKHLEAALEDHNVGNRVTGVIMDVNTGAILAMATKGDYDPNSPFEISEEAKESLSGLEGEEYAEALAKLQNEQWRNKIVSEVYEPGSVFKIITAAAALEEGVISADDLFSCTGSMRVADRTIHCWKRDGSHGTQNLTQALCNSCNCAFMQIAEKLGVTRFMKYYEAFGLTEKTGIDLPGEENGIAHTAVDMGPVELAVSSFGQTFKVTPIQMITAISSVANGGELVTPYVVENVVDVNGNTVYSNEGTVRRQVISKETSELMCKMLSEVVATGSGRNAYVAGYRIAGKTGTSEKTDLYDKDGNKREEVIASFCGFAPADDPQIAVLVLLDEPDSFSNFGGQIAAPVVADIMEDVLDYLGVEPSYTEKELEKLAAVTPDFSNMTADRAAAAAKKAGLNITKVGDGERVLYQIPAAGADIPKGGNVVLVYGEDSVKTVKVPDLVGRSLGSANSELMNKKLNVLISGAVAGQSDAVIYSQSPEGGTEVEIGTVIELRLSYADQVE